MVTNKNVLHYVRAFRHEFNTQPGDRMLQHSVCSFDIFVEEVFTTLLSGATLCIPKEETKADIHSCGGLCLYDEMPSPDNPTGRCAYLMNIYVRPEYQGHGYGKRIVRWLVGVALSRGIKKIYLETSEAGRLLYSFLGFSDMKDMMHLTFQ